MWQSLLSSQLIKHKLSNTYRIAHGNRWCSPRANMTSCLLSVTFKIRRAKVFVEETDKNWGFLTRVLLQIHSLLGDVKIPVVIENQYLMKRPVVWWILKIPFYRRANLPSIHIYQFTLLRAGAQQIEEFRQTNRRFIKGCTEYGCTECAAISTGRLFSHPNRIPCSPEAQEHQMNCKHVTGPVANSPFLSKVIEESTSDFSYSFFGFHYLIHNYVKTLYKRNEKCD